MKIEINLNTGQVTIGDSEPLEESPPDENQLSILQRIQNMEASKRKPLMQTMAGMVTLTESN